MGVDGAAIVRRFFDWAQRVDAEQRAEGASVLARAYLHSDLPQASKAQFVVAMTMLLDDPHRDVRRALAEALAAAPEAPRALVVALAHDVDQVAAPLLARSPILTDADLIDCVTAGGAVAQCAIARRAKLGPGPADALANGSERAAALALIRNVDARPSRAGLETLIRRFGNDPEARVALLERPDLPAVLRAEITIGTMNALADLLVSRGRLNQIQAERSARDSRDAALAGIAADCADGELAELARALRERGVLTLALLLRSLLGGDRTLLAASLSELSGLPPRRVAGFVGDPNGGGFAAAALVAGLPRHALPVFRAALGAIETQGAERGAALKAPLVRSAIAACERSGDPALEPILALLSRFEAEAARAQARSSARIAARMGRLPPQLDFSPANDEEVVAPLSAPLGYLGSAA
jgi:uncharacterized protein (DUF2336 family)